jgi:hypothetical protein
VPHPQPRRLTRLRRAVLLLAFLGLLAELGGYAIVWKIIGHRPSAANVAELQAEIAGTGAQGQGATDLIGTPHLRHEVLHPYLGYIPMPTRKTRLDDGFWLNEAGFYRRDSPIFDRSDALVIGITGGSVAGQFLQMGREALAAELAEHPSFAGREVRFVGLAFGGFKQPQQLMALAYLLPMGGRLDMLINIDGFNEVALHETSNARQGVAPIYPRDWFFRAVRDEFLTGELAALGKLRRERRSRAAAAPRSLFFGHTWTGRAAWLVADRNGARASRRLERELRKTTQPRDLQRGGPHLNKDAQTDQVRIWRDSSLQLHRLCTANEIEYFHALQPNQYVEGSKQLTEQELAKAYAPERGYAPSTVLAYPALIAAGRGLERKGVPYLDLTTLFEHVDRTIYVDNCCHMNELGNQLMARALGQFILSYTE